jgi:hypothetical protein
MVNYEKQTTHPSKQNLEAITKQTIPSNSKPLVGDEIQRRNNETRRGGAKVEKLR